MVVFRFETSTKVTILKWVHDIKVEDIPMGVKYLALGLTRQDTMSVVNIFPLTFHVISLADRIKLGLDFLIPYSFSS